MPRKNPKDNPVSDHPNVQSRTVPYSYEAEQAILGTVLMDDNAPILVLDGLRAEDFYNAAHRKIWTAMLNLANTNRPIDLVALTNELDVLGFKEQVGGARYLSSLSDIVPSGGNFSYYRQIVRKNSILRQLLQICQQTMDLAYAGDAEENALTQAESGIFGLAQDYQRSTLTQIQPSVVAAYNELQERHMHPDQHHGIATPYLGLNKILGGGFQNSDLILVAARPGQGKTALGMNLIAHAATRVSRRGLSGQSIPHRCAVFSLEMSSQQLAKRLLCSMARVDLHLANSGKLGTIEFNKLNDARATLAQSSIYINDSSMVTPAEILSTCRRLKREGGLDMIMIDYLQLMSGGKRYESRQVEVADITRSLKIAAKELDVPIVLLSQVNREIDKRADRTPQMSDLRESGAIEQDADIIIFISKKTNDPNAPIEDRREAKLIVAKHRNGVTGDTDVRWEGSFVSFVDINDPVAPASTPPAPATVTADQAREFDDALGD